MRTTLWMLVGLLALTGCEEQAPPPEKPAAAKEDTAPAQPAQEAKGDTKPAKDEPAAGEGQSEEAKSLTERSKKLLEALKSKSVDAIVEFVPEKAREEAKTSFADGGKAAKSFFGEGEWRWKAISAWDGKFHGIRKDGDKVRVKFAEIDEKESVVIEWVKTDDGWWFEDVKSPSNEDFAGWGEELK